VKTPPAVTDLALIPVLLTIREVAAVYRVSVSTIRRGLKDRTFTPRPWTTRSHFLWRRDDVIADINRPRRPTPDDDGGGKREPAKATLAPRRAARKVS